MNRQKVLVAAIASLVASTLGLAVFYSAVSLLQTESRISSGGTVKGIGVEVYSDAECTTSVSSIEWGILEPDQSKGLTFYIRNEGNSALTLSMSTENWTPASASEFITLSWDYGGQTIDPDAVFEVTFTLAVSASISDITEFSFDIVIVGSG